MKALKWFGPKGKVELVEMATDMSTQEDSVIIKVMFSGVCGSDLLLLAKKMDAVDGVIPGHEIAGVIEKVGTKVTNLQPGDKVVVMPQGYCGKCRNCLRGQVKYCIHYDYVGFEAGQNTVNFQHTKFTSCQRHWNLSMACCVSRIHVWL